MIKVWIDKYEKENEDDDVLPTTVMEETIVTPKEYADILQKIVTEHPDGYFDDGIEVYYYKVDGVDHGFGIRWERG